MDVLICNHCVATWQDKLRQAGLPHEPNLYCLACGFEIRSNPNIAMLKGSVCASCAAQIAAKVGHAV
jgi:hypothetical protein